MRLRGIDFGSILGASGVQGFFGEGYWFHRLWLLMGMRLSGVTFVAKTATCEPREGNMPLTEAYRPREWFPECVKVQPLRGNVLNAVGLSNPGLWALLDEGKWQKRARPFWLSIMATAETPMGRREEIRRMVAMIGERKAAFAAPFGLQINFSCPNTGHDPRVLVTEVANALDIASSLGPDVPFMPKFSIATAPIAAVRELNQHPACDALCVSNSLPYGWEGLDWKKVWGTAESPLEKLGMGKGGLSGRALRPLVCDYIERLRDAGFAKPINGGGGIMHAEDVRSFHKAGASSIFVGSVIMLRPWNLRSIMGQANRLNWNRE